MNKIEKDSPIWEELAKVCTSPGHFIRCAMCITDISTSSKLGDKTGINANSLNMYITNRCQIPANKIVKISNALGFDEYLFNKLLFNYYKDKQSEK